MLNAAPARSDVPEALLAATDILCVNQTEAEVMSGKADVEAAAMALRAKGCNCVIVTLVKYLAQSRSADVLSGWTFCQEDVLSGPP